jgi:hypothetical protein
MSWNHISSAKQREQARRRVLCGLPLQSFPSFFISLAFMTLLRASGRGADSKLALPTFPSLSSHFSISLSIAEVAIFDLGKSVVILDMLIWKAVRWMAVSSLL